jgi:enamine deaminase RidA (YjgF/YER057c/UK114 family)
MVEMDINIEYINPEGMVTPRGYSHAIAVRGKHTTIYIGGQNAIDKNGTVTGKGDIKAQTEQALSNVETVLDAAGATLRNVVKFNIYLIQGQNPQEGFLVFQKKWGTSPDFPTITVLFVSGLGNPDWLIEIDAVAVIPE